MKKYYKKTKICHCYYTFPFSFQRVKDVSASYSENQHSGEWLATHSIEALELTIKQLVDKGKVGK
jgi:hypothetical protein